MKNLSPKFWQALNTRIVDEAVPGPQGPQGVQGPTGPQGPAGADGRTFNFRGAWNASTAYARDNVVHHDGSTWIATAASTGATPSLSSNVWDEMALQGATGPMGPQGVQGPVGPQGPQGIQGNPGVDARPIKTLRANVASIAGASSAERTFTWSTPFPDNNYTVSAVMEEGTAGMNSLRVRRIVSRTPATVTVRIENTSTLTAFSGTLHLIGIQD